MPQNRLWKIIDDKSLKEIPVYRPNLEKYLENWITEDISIISDDLLVIGRQESTDFGKIPDLLCIDEKGVMSPNN